jgi:hypothetical protein
MRPVFIPLTVALWLVAAASAQAFTEFQVDRTDDAVTGSWNSCTGAPSDCTFRGALDRADNTVDNARFVSLPAGVYRRDPAQEAVTALQSVTIAGAGARSTVIEGANTNGSGPTLTFFVQGGQVTPNTSAIRDVTITKGVSNGGGGIRSAGTNLFLDRVTVSGNVAPGIDFMFKTPGIGAGITFETPGRTLTIDNSTITGNRAEGRAGMSAVGGGVWVFQGSATIRSSTIAGNVADGDGGPAQGGGLSATSNGSIALDRVTVAGNVAEDVGAGQAVANVWRDAGSTITAARSIVADGVAPAGSNAENCATPITTQGSNVEDRNQCGFGAGDRRNAAVGLGPLGNYGGQTDTRPITQTSPAFDFGGDCQLGDQRGFGAAFAACDSGAYEYQQGDPDDFGGGPGGSAPAADKTPPSVTGYGLSNTRFAAAGSGASIKGQASAKAKAKAKARIGTAVNYTLSESATLTFTVERIKGGRRVAGRCKKPTRKIKSKPKCGLLLKGSFSSTGGAGKNGIGFSGRLNRKKLSPGGYHLVATGRDAAGNVSKPARTRFTIVKG